MKFRWNMKLFKKLCFMGKLIIQDDKEWKITLHWIGNSFCYKQHHLRSSDEITVHCHVIKSWSTPEYQSSLEKYRDHMCLRISDTNVSTDVVIHRLLITDLLMMITIILCWISKNNYTHFLKCKTEDYNLSSTRNITRHVIVIKMKWWRNHVKRLISIEMMKKWNETCCHTSSMMSNRKRFKRSMILWFKMKGSVFTLMEQVNVTKQ